MLAPELEAIASAAAERLRAQSSAEPHDADALDEAVARAASVAIGARRPLAAIAEAERTGQTRAREELGSENAPWRATCRQAPTRGRARV